MSLWGEGRRRQLANLSGLKLENHRHSPTPKPAGQASFAAYPAPPKKHGQAGRRASPPTLPPTSSRSCTHGRRHQDHKLRQPDDPTTPNETISTKCPTRTGKAKNPPIANAISERSERTTREQAQRRRPNQKPRRGEPKASPAKRRRSEPLSAPCAESPAILRRRRR